MQSFAEEIYSQAAPSAEGGAASEAASGAEGASEPKQAEGETVDADFEVVDEDDKK